MDKIKPRSHRLTAADQPDSDALDSQCPRARIDNDRREIGVFGDQLDNPVVLTETLDRHRVSEPGDDNLAVARLAAAVHGEQVTVQNAGVDHRQATHAQQKIGTRLEQADIECITALDVFHRQDRAPGSHAADQRQTQLFDQPDAARRSRFEHDDALPGKRLEMLLGGIVRGKTEGAGNFGPCWRRAEKFQRIADEVEYFLLAQRYFCLLYTSRCV